MLGSFCLVLLQCICDVCISSLNLKKDKHAIVYISRWMWFLFWITNCYFGSLGIVYSSMFKSTFSMHI